MVLIDVDLIFGGTQLVQLVQFNFVCHLMCLVWAMLILSGVYLNFLKNISVNKYTKNFLVFEFYLFVENYFI